MPVIRRYLREDKSGTLRRQGDRAGKTPKGTTGTWVQAEGGKGGAHWHGNGSRRRHTARGAGTSGGGWRVAGEG